MAPAVVSAIHKGKHRLEIVFQDGKTGVVDFERYIEEGGFLPNSEISMPFSLSLSIPSWEFWPGLVTSILRQKHFIQRRPASPCLNGCM
jgi:hypothetical protein